MRVFLQLFIVILLCLIFQFVLFGQTVIAKAEPTPSAERYILMDETTGRVLLEKNAHERVSIASITKLMTAVVALQYGNMDDRIKVSEKALQTSGSSIYLEKGDELTLEDLLYGLMLRSGNDAAKVIAEHIGGSEEGFVYLMNETAAYIGMTDSHFMNPHGLDEDNHYSSAHDVAILMQYAMQDDLFREISSTKSYHSKQRTYPWKNKNKLLTEKYSYTTGGKTGFTNQAGRTLVTTAEKSNMKFITVTLDAPDDWNDHISLYNWGFDLFSLVQVEKAGIRDFDTDEGIVSGQVPYDVKLLLRHEEQDFLKNNITLYRQAKDNKLGVMSYYVADEESLLDVPIYQTVSEEQTVIEKWQQWLTTLFVVDKDD